MDGRSKGRGGGRGKVGPRWSKWQVERMKEITEAIVE